MVNPPSLNGPLKRCLAQRTIFTLFLHHLILIQLQITLNGGTLEITPPPGRFTLYFWGGGVLPRQGVGELFLCWLGAFLNLPLTTSSELFVVTFQRLTPRLGLGETPLASGTMAGSGRSGAASIAS